MADMDFQLVLEAVVKGQDALDKLAKTEDQITKAAKAANDAQAATAGKAEAAMKRESEAMQRAATAAKGLGAGAHAASAASTQQASAAERVANAERRAADATRAHATAATQEAHAVQAAARAQTAATGGVARATAVAVQQRRMARRQFMAEAASQATPYGYMLGAGAAVAGGAAVGIAAYAGYEASARLARASVGEAISREVAFAQVQKKVNLEAGQSWEQMDRQIAKVSTTLGKTYQDAAAMFDQGGASGIAGKDLEQFAMLAGKVSTAWDIGTREAALGLAETRAQTGKTLPQLEIFADKINYLGDISAAAEKDIFNMSQRAMAAMKAAGVGEDQALTLMTGLRSVGMQDEVASRFLGQFSSTLRRASMLDPGVQKAFKEIGLTGKQIERGMQIDAMRTMVDLLDRLGKAKNPVAIANSIFGGQWFDEVLRMKDALPEIKRVFDALGKGGYLGSMTSAMNIEMSTTEAKLNKLSASVKDLMATMAKPVAKDWIEPAVDAATKKVDEWRRAEERSQQDRKRSQQLAAESKPQGRSIDKYQRDMFDRPKPMFTQIEGSAPHIAQTPGTGRGFGRSVLDVSQFGPAAEAITSKADSAYEALQKLDGQNVSVSVDTAAVGSLEAIAKAARDAAAALNAVKNMAPGFHMPSLPSTPAMPSGGGLGKQSGLSTGIIHAHGGLRPTHVAHGGTTVHYAPTLHVASGDEKTFRQQLREHSREIASIVGEDRDRRGRLSFRETA